MAIDLKAKRAKWIKTGFGLIYGPLTPGPMMSNGQSGLYAAIVTLQSWLAEGIAAGFVPATAGGTAPANIVVDADFAGLAQANAALFLQLVGVLQTLGSDYTNNYALFAQLKP